MEMGHFVMLCADYTASKRAPVARSKSEVLVMPDMFICKDGLSWLGEVKTKKSAGWRKDRQRFEHGMDYSSYVAYLEVEKQTGLEVYVYVFELDTLEVQYIPLRAIDPVLSRDEKVFWPRSQMSLFCVSSKQQVERYLPARSRPIKDDSVVQKRSVRDT